MYGSGRTRTLKRPQRGHKVAWMVQMRLRTHRSPVQPHIQLRILQSRLQQRRSICVEEKRTAYYKSNALCPYGPGQRSKLSFITPLDHLVKELEPAMTCQSRSKCYGLKPTYSYCKIDIRAVRDGTVLTCFYCNGLFISRMFIKIYGFFAFSGLNQTS